MFFLALLAAPATAQDFIHYKFDSTCTAEVINYAAGPASFAGNGVLQSNAATQFTGGVFGSALAAGDETAGTYNRVSSGWIPQNQPINGDLTMAFHVRQLGNLGSGSHYLIGSGTSGSYRVFSGGIANNGLVARQTIVSGGTPQLTDCQLPDTAFDFVAAAAAGWVHVALVVEAATASYTWYIDGNPVHSRTGIGAGRINGAGEFRIGSYATTSPSSSYAFDEFLLARRAYSAAEVQQLANAAHAGEGDYTSGIASQCGAGNVTVGSNGTQPSLGNGGYAIRIASTQSSFFLLLPGLTRCSYGGVIPLPFDATPISPELAGCMVVADAVTLLGGVVTTGVPVDLPLPIPGNPAYFGAPLFFQALTLDLSNLSASMSNGFAVGIGQ
ncbi:MAG: LamG-like jellyroll fold domain-containing protein [Planctomycetota bacterium]